VGHYNRSAPIGGYDLRVVLGLGVFCFRFAMENAQPPQDARDTAGVVAPPPLIYLAGLAVGFGLEALLPGPSLPGALRWIGGGVLVVAGAALLATFNTAFTKKGTAVEPWKPTTAIVTTGPYRVTRNPAYLGMALVYIGIALLAGALWVLVPLPLVLVVIDRAVIAREERYLERKFGEEYLDYRRGVRRWI
jgi:protein-S-isoprenylcysteine O-methyltransferase Ste14